MPGMYMDVDVALSEVPINIAALIDDTDFKTREEAVTFDQAGLDLVWNFVTSAGVSTQTAVTPTDTAGDYDWVHQGNAMYTIEIPASGGASINNDTTGYGWFSGFATGVLPWIGPVIGFREAGAEVVAALEDAGLVLETTTIATLASQTSFTLTAGSADDDAYNGCLIVLEDASTATQKAMGLIDDYTGSTKTITLQTDPGIFTMAATDKVRIISVNALEIVKANYDRRLTGANHNEPTSAGKILRELSTAFLLHSGTAQAGAAASITLDAGASAVDDFYHHARVVIQAGTGLEQQALIVHYNGTTKVAKISPPWATIPDATSEFAIEPALSHADTGWATIEVGTVVAATSTTVTLDAAEASAVDDFYKDDLIKIHAGTGDGQIRVITAYNGTTKVATVHAAWLTTPDTTSEYIVEDGHPYAPLIKTEADKIAALDVTGSVSDVSPAAGDFDGDSGLSATDDFYNGSVLVFTGGTLTGLGRQISDYTGSSKRIQFTGAVGDADEAFPSAPADSDPFVILGRIGS